MTWLVNEWLVNEWLLNEWLLNECLVNEWRILNALEICRKYVMGATLQLKLKI